MNDWHTVKRLIFYGVVADGSSVSMYGPLLENLKKEDCDALERLLVSGRGECVLDFCFDCIENKIFYSVLGMFYVLARCCCFQGGGRWFRRKAYWVLKAVCKSSPDLFVFLELYDKLCLKHNWSRGWSKQHRDFVSQWYLEKPIEVLMYELTRYKSGRFGWTHRDVLRLCHVKARDVLYNSLFDYATCGKVPRHEELEYILAFEALKDCHYHTIASALVLRYGFVSDQLPAPFLKSPCVWWALAKRMDTVEDMASLLCVAGSTDVFDIYPEIVGIVTDKIERLGNTGIWPLWWLVLLRSSSSFIRHEEIVGALDRCFMRSFPAPYAMPVSVLVALDVSGSMSCSGLGGISNLTCAEVACAMALVFQKRYSTCDIMAFTKDFKELSLNWHDGLDNNIEKMYGHTFGYTDCCLPLQWASEKKKAYDCVIIVGDDSFENGDAVAKELERYRENVGLRCKFVVVGLTMRRGDDIGIAEPANDKMLDISGFDASICNIIDNFICK